MLFLDLSHVMKNIYFPLLFLFAFVDLKAQFLTIHMELLSIRRAVFNIADRFNHKIRKLSQDGNVSTLVGSGLFGSNDGLATAATFNEPWGICFQISMWE